ERYDEAIKWPGFTKYFMPVWALEEINKLWGPIPRSVLAKWDDESYQADYEQIVAKVDYVDYEKYKTFTSATYRFVSREVYDGTTNIKLEEVLEILLWEAHLECDLNDGDSKIMEKQLKKLECNVFTTLNEANKEHYNKPKSKTFASIDSFNFDNNDLALFQITVSENHGLRYLTAKDEDSQKAQGWSNKITQYALKRDLRMTRKRSINEMLEDNKTVEASRRKVGTKQHNSSDVTMMDNKSVI
ncbi:33662_t:CDS:2, partial [Gigaspora margarita]